MEKHISTYRNILLLVIVAASVSYYGYLQWNYTFAFSEGEKQASLTSSDGKYTAEWFFQNYGGAAGGVNLFVNVTFHDKDDEVRTVYFGPAKSDVHIEWQHDAKLSIKNRTGGADYSIALAVEKEIYDARGKACRNIPLRLTYSCYSK